jgi:hypothetical protein
MSVTTEKLAGESIVILTLIGEDVQKIMQQFGPKALHDVQQLMSEIEGPIYYINDFSQFGISFSNLVLALDDITRGQASTLFGPQVHMILVGTSEMVKLWGEAAKQKQYGERKIPVFSSRDEAIAYARQQLGG